MASKTLPIKITTKNTERIDQFIESWQDAEKCLVRRATASGIKAGVKMAEKFLSRILYKKDWIGLAVCYSQHAQNFPSIYRGTPVATQIVIERTSSGWFLRSIYRGDCPRASAELSFCNLETKTDEILDYITTNTTKIARS